MAEHSSLQSAPFFKLSSELRNLVYKHLFDEISESLTLCVCCNTTATFSSPPVQVLAVSHQIRTEALPVLKDSLSSTKLIFDGCGDHFLEGDDAPRTWILKTYGALFTDIEWDVTWGHRLPNVVDALPKLRRVTMVGYVGFPPSLFPEDPDYEFDYWTKKENHEELWQFFDQDTRPE